MCDRITRFPDAFEEYSYQYNVLNLWLSALGVENVAVSDIDIAHRIPSRTAYNRPNAWICKFIRRISKEKVMAKRNEASNKAAAELDFQIVWTSLTLIV